MYYLVEDDILKKEDKFKNKKKLFTCFFSKVHRFRIVNNNLKFLEKNFI